MRNAGILLHISSLPGAGGIGSLGKNAYAFADFLQKAGMRIWQVLPCGPVGYGESPYQSMSTFAGNPMLVDLEALVEDGLLPALPDEYAAMTDNEHIDFERVRRVKSAALEEAFAHFSDHKALNAFIAENDWVPGYALFAAIKEHFGGISWLRWPDEGARMRSPETLARYGDTLRERVRYHAFVQMLFFSQWRALKEYANARGVSLFGDMPIYIAEDSADMWQNPEQFQLDGERRPLRVAGVPPDYFSADGQLWGNPLYDWKRMRRDGYRWWIARMRGAQRMYDMVRVDHFIGFANYYAVRAGMTTARYGVWRVGPGRDLFIRLQRALPGLSIIAEDLGVVGPRVKKLLKFCGYPGMKVLQFGFDGGEDNPHHPRNIVRNCIAYTGTHDNDTARGWWETSAWESAKGYARYVMGMNEHDDISWKMIETVFSSQANTAIAPMQDFLCFGHDMRMNLPGTTGGNWGWRMRSCAMSDELCQSIRALNERNGRL